MLERLGRSMWKSLGSLDETVGDVERCVSRYRGIMTSKAKFCIRMPQTARLVIVNFQNSRERVRTLEVNGETKPTKK